MHDYGLWGTVPSEASRLSARAARLGRRAAARPATRCWSRRSTRPQRAVEMIERHAARAGRGDRRAAAARAAARAGLPRRRSARSTQTPRHRAGLRRDRDRLSHRLGRRAGALRRRARPRLLRQGDQRRLPAGGHRRHAATSWRCSTRARGRAADVVWATQHAERQPGVRGRRPRGARRACRSPGIYDHLHAHRRAAARGHRRGRRSATASRCRRPARTRCSACASPTAGRCAPGWTSRPRDKELGWRWAHRADQARPAGQPEREVLHLDRAHRRRRRPHARDRGRGVRGAARADRAAGVRPSTACTGSGAACRPRRPAACAGLPGSRRSCLRTTHAWLSPSNASMWVAIAIEEPAVVGDHHGAAGEIEERLLEGAQRLDVEVVGRLVEQQHVAAAPQQLREMHAVALAARRAPRRASAGRRP